ncbi:MAG: L-threonylcarbamoyladenylate synthase [Mycoplasmoidaceae bacterium]
MVLYNNNDTKFISFELKNRKVLICPTDTVNGVLSMHKSDIYKVKKRRLTKKIILFISNVFFIKNPSKDLIKLAKCFWPGKLTLIYNGKGYRCPNDPFILDLLEHTGPLYSSSANISGQEPCRSTLDAYQSLSKYKRLIVVKGSSDNNSLPSTIYNVDKKKIIREGQISLAEINKCLSK